MNSKMMTNTLFSFLINCTSVNFLSHFFDIDLDIKMIVASIYPFSYSKYEINHDFFV